MRCLWAALRLCQVGEQQQLTWPTLWTCTSKGWDGAEACLPGLPGSLTLVSLQGGSSEWWC